MSKDFICEISLMNTCRKLFQVVSQAVMFLGTLCIFSAKSGEILVSALLIDLFITYRLY